jgi:hypothetical protein
LYATEGDLSVMAEVDEYREAAQQTTLDQAVDNGH